MAKKIKISDEVWAAIAERGKFGETEDTVLRRVFGLSGNGIQGQTRESGARAAKWGKETADKIAGKLGAEKINPRSNEYKLDGTKFTIRCAHAKTNTVGVLYHMLKRIDSVIAALENESGEFELFKLTPDQYESEMRETQSNGPSKGRVGMVRTRYFRDHGEPVATLSFE